MKKILLFLLVTLLSSHVLFAQDLIVTNDGDSINCRITKMDAKYIYFTFKYENEIRNTLLSYDNVKVHTKNYYITSEVPETAISNGSVYKPFRLAFNAGFTSNITKIEDGLSTEAEDYVRGLKTGYCLGGEMDLFFSEMIGLGARYSIFNSQNSNNNVYYTDVSGIRHRGDLSENIRVSYIGPTLATRFFDRKKTGAFFMNYTIGLMSYRDNLNLIDDFKITGNTVGVGFDIGYDLGLSENMFLGFQLSLLGGALSEVKVSDGTQSETVKLDDDQREGLSRIELTIGLRFSD